VDGESEQDCGRRVGSDQSSGEWRDSGVDLHRVYVLNTRLFILRIQETIPKWVVHGVTLVQE